MLKKHYQDMKNNNSQSTKGNKANPLNYNVDHNLAVTIWKTLFKQGDEETCRILSNLMIEQGCQEIEIQDMTLILAFWKDYMEEHNLLFLSPEKKDLH